MLKQKPKKIENYVINSCTMFIIPVKFGSKIYSKIYEVEDVFLCPLKPFDIIKHSCQYFGGDYESKRKGSRSIVGNKRKLPIVIEVTNHLFMFPTLSPNSKECIWISYEHVKDFHRTGPLEASILFYNKETHRFPVSCSTIEIQLFKTSFLKNMLMQRIENNNRKYFYFLDRAKIPTASEGSQKYDREF